MRSRIIQQALRLADDLADYPLDAVDARVDSVHLTARRLRGGRNYSDSEALDAARATVTQLVADAVDDLSSRADVSSGAAFPRACLRATKLALSIYSVGGFRRQGPKA